MSVQTASPAPPRSAIGLLTDRQFGSFFAGRLSTSIGVWLHGIVAAIAAFGATHSALAVGLVSVVQFTPQLVLAPLSGKWSDRGDVKRQMLLGRTVSAIGSLALAGWFLFTSVDGWASVAAVTIASFVVGIGLVVGGPAMQSAVPLLVSRDEIPAAMALNTAPITLGRIAGPALGAIATAGGGYEFAFFLASVANFGFVALVHWITFPAPEGRKEGDVYSVRAALAFVRADRPTLLILLGVTALGFGSEPTVTLAPPLAAELGGGTPTVGALTSSMGIGAAVGVIVTSWLAERVRHDHFATAGIVLMAIGLGICAAPLGVHAAMGGFGLTGLGFIISVSSLSTLMQIRLPATLRGRVMALWLMGFVGARPIGALLVGALSDGISVRVAFGFTAAIMLGAAVLCRPSRLREKDEGALRALTPLAPPATDL
jgi:MFS family permease